MVQETQVGVLAFHNSRETRAILNAVAALQQTPVWLRADNITVRVVDGDILIDPPVDVVINRTLLSLPELPAEALGLIDVYEQRMPVLNGAAAVATARHKVAAKAALAAEGLPVPDMFFAADHALLDRGRQYFTDEVVYKTVIGTHGGGVWREPVDEQLTPHIVNRHAFLEQFIETTGERQRDLRIYVVDDAVIGVMERTARKSDWRTNIARGGRGRDVTGDTGPAVTDLAKQAANATELDYAGVDIIQDAAGDPYILEVNPTAGFKGFYAATGVNPAPYIARMAIERADGEVDTARVEELADELDDTPFLEPAEPDEPTAVPTVIGYTQSVTVSGTTGTTMALAKADTGAARTSIDLELASRIGAGPITSTTEVRTGARKAGKSRPVVDVMIGIDGEWHTVSASIEDRDHMMYPVLLGRDILKHYRVDVTQVAEE